MYNLIEYSSNYSETTGSSWFYSKDEDELILMLTLLIMIISNPLNIRLNY